MHRECARPVRWAAAGEFTGGGGLTGPSEAAREAAAPGARPVRWAAAGELTGGGGLTGPSEAAREAAAPGARARAGTRCSC